MPATRKRRGNRDYSRPNKRVKFSEDTNKPKTSSDKKGVFIKGKKHKGPGGKPPMKNKKFPGSSSGSSKYKNKFSKSTRK